MTDGGRRQLRKLGLLAACVLPLAGCGGGGDSSPAPAAPTVAPTVATPTITVADSSRAAKQGTFGPTQALVDHIVSLGGVGPWVEEQATTTASTYNDLITRAVPTNYCTGKTGTDATVCNRDYLSSLPVAMEFYAHAVGAPDQLRQRIAFALSQLIVASDFEVHSTAGLAAFNEILLDNAFGNYRDILKAVTLNPYMGDYLDMVDSSKSAPSENYARELMQLFSTGVNVLNADGTPQKDASGAPIPVYTADDVHSVARALTGWTYAKLPGAAANDGTARDYTKAMVVNAAAYDTGAKTFLGATVAANAAQADSLGAVVDAVFNNASTAPYVSKFLIQQLVTSNPSAAYVGRVSAVFANNGAGVRGDLKAVVKAILTDAEARGDAKTGASDGKVKEPALLMVSIARLIGDKTDGYAFTTRDAAMGEAPFRAPSVFNFYPPDYPLAGSAGLVSPPSKLLTTATAITRHNLVYDWTVSGDVASRGEYAAQTTITGAIGTAPDWSSWEAFGTNLDGMLDRINALLLNNSMTVAQRASVKAAMAAVSNADPTLLARKQAQVALYITASSPQFQVDR